MNPLWNLEKTHDEEMAKAKAEFMPPVGTKIEQAREIIRRCEERDKSLLEQALAMEADGDTQGCWFAMAGRANNARFMERVHADLRSLENANCSATGSERNDHE